MNILTKLSNIVTAAFEQAGIDAKYAPVTVSNRPDLCQFQSNGCLLAAKEYKKNPLELAGQVAQILAAEPCIEAAQAAPPGFVNIIVTGEFLAQNMQEMLNDDRLCVDKLPNPGKLVVDYGGPNIAKPLHVGHLRSAIIGQSLKNLAAFLGHEVIGDIHMGDWGLQMGLVIAQIKTTQPGLNFFDDSFTGEYDKIDLTLEQLNQIYPAASARSKTDEEFRALAMAITRDLQNHKPGYFELWKQIVAVSIQDLKRNYKTLGVDFEVWYGESHADPYIQPLIQLLNDKKLTHLDEGALIVDIEQPDDQEPMPPVLISKSDGAQLYATTDLATLMQRMKDYNPAQIWYVVDNRQTLHFKQVFRCAQMAGIVDERVNLEYIGFGTMNGKDGKPYKTRDGGVMRLSDLIETIKNGALEKISDETEAGLKQQIGEHVGIAALKFGDLSNHRTKDYVFDLDRFLAFEGKTGPYLQYTTVRINSVLQKAEQSETEFCKITAPASEAETQLMLKINKTEQYLLRAYEERSLNGICECAYEIAAAFNRFYFETKILSHQDVEQRASWLALLRLSRNTLALLLGVLGIEIPERM